ncbi:hypothetical protein FS749_002269, partial [Ceratobasidium sp. UAMH 11750]
GLNQETLVANNSNNPTTEVAVAVVAQAEQNPQASASHPESVTLHGQDEVVPALIAPHTPLPVPGHAILAVSVPPLLVPAATPPTAPVPNGNLNVGPAPNPAHTGLMGSLNGIGGIQVAENEIPENLVAEAPAGQNGQEPVILSEHAMPNQVAYPDAPFVQPFVPAQAMPAVAVVMVVQPAALVINNNLGQPPLLRTFYGFAGIQFEAEGDDEDD